MSTNDLLLCMNYPAVSARQAPAKTTVDQYENEKSSPWWAHRQPDGVRSEKSIAITSITILTCAFKRIG